MRSGPHSTVLGTALGSRAHATDLAGDAAGGGGGAALLNVDAILTVGDEESITTVDGGEPILEVAGELWWHYEIGESEIDTEVVVPGELPNHLRATRFGDLSAFERDLLLPLDEVSGHSAGNRWPYYDAAGGLNDLPRIYGGVQPLDFWLLRCAVDIPAGTELTIWGVVKVTAEQGGIHRRTWTCSGAADLSATGGRTGFACSSSQIRFYTITDGGTQQTTDVAASVGQHVAKIVYRAGQPPQLWLDGVLVGTAPDAGGVAALSFIGHGGAGSSQASEGFLFMGVVGSTASKRAEIDAYITQQTGLES
jgi:hypothetical protein